MDAIGEDEVRPTVYLVSASSSLMAEYARLAAQQLGFTPLEFDSFDHFLAHYDSKIIGCVVLFVERVDEASFSYFSQILAGNRAAQVLVSPRYWQAQDVVRAIQNGFADFWDFTTDINRVGEAVSAAVQRDRAMRTGIQEELPRRLLELINSAEAEILRLIVQGRTTKQISAALDISVRTVHYRKKSIYSKLGLSSRGEALEVIRSIRHDGSSRISSHIPITPHLTVSAPNLIA